MGKTVGYLMAVVGMATLSFLSMVAGGQAQSIENGIGVLCDSPEQVDEFIKLGIDPQSAVEKINGESKSRVCEILNVAFLVGGIVGESANDKGTWQIRRILVVGLIIGRSTSPVQPYQKYTAFIIAKASPIRDMNTDKDRSTKKCFYSLLWRGLSTRSSFGCDWIVAFNARGSSSLGLCDADFRGAHDCHLFVDVS